MVAVLVVTQTITVIALAFLLFHMLKQQGRILIRLDNIEAGNSGFSLPADLEAGSTVTDFRLPDLSGKTVSLSDFRNRRVLLIYWSPECGFCDMLAAEMPPVIEALKKNNADVVLVAYGDAESNRKMLEEHGVNCTTLLVENSPDEKIVTGELFRHRGTPSAYLLDEAGRVLQELAVGMDNILELARKAGSGDNKGALRKRPLTESRIVRDGIKAGTPAPEFTLPDVNGRTVSLEQYRDRNVLLVFSDPQCGPCDALAPELARLHQKHAGNGLDFVMVGRGDPEQNKNKAIEHGIAFPVLLQEKWKLSKQYGIFATPVAFLIGKDGRIARNVATGRDEILALAHEALAVH